MPYAPNPGTWISNTVTAARTRKTAKYGFFTCSTTFASPVKGSAAGVPVAIGSSDQIHDREQEDPHDVDEVPVQADELDALVALLREPVLLPRLDVQVREADHPAHHVGPVEPRLHVERRPERREVGPEGVHPRGEVLLEEQLVVLEHLDRDERDPQEERREEREPEVAEVALLDPLQGLDHREAARDQDERVYGGEGDVQRRVDAGGGPVRRPCPEREGVADDRGEEEDLGDEEEPHPQLADADAAEHAGFGRVCDLPKQDPARVL